jgi:hypothetical protein
MDTEGATGLDKPAAHTVQRRTTWFILGVLACVLLYSALVTSSAGHVAGGYTTDGYLDAAGNPAESAPLGVHVTSGPGRGMLLAVGLAAAASIAVAHVHARRGRASDAVAVLDRAQMVIALVTILGAVAVTWWVTSHAVPGWDGTDSYTAWAPHWLAQITITISSHP